MRRKMEINRMLDAIGQLKSTERAVLVLCELEGRSAAEVARLLGMTTANVYTINFRAKANLRKVMSA